MVVKWLLCTAAVKKQQAHQTWTKKLLESVGKKCGGWVFVRDTLIMDVDSFFELAIGQVTSGTWLMMGGKDRRKDPSFGFLTCFTTV